MQSHPEFADRKTTRLLDGKAVSGYFASDFTLEEIRRLRAVQANPSRSKEYDGRFMIPTFEEILQLRSQLSRQHGRAIGVYPETKHPAFHLALGLELEEPVLEALRRHQLDHEHAPVFIQSFESANLQYLRTRTRLPLVQLLDDGALKFDAGGVRIVAIDIPQFGDGRGGVGPRSFSDIARYASANDRGGADYSLRRAACTWRPCWAAAPRPWRPGTP